MAITKILFCSPSKAGKQQAKQANQQTDAQMRADECREMKIGDYTGERRGVGWLKLFAWLVQLPVVYQTIIYQGCAVQQEQLLSLRFEAPLRKLIHWPAGKTILMTRTGSERSEQSSSSSCCMQQTLL